MWSPMSWSIASMAMFVLPAPVGAQTKRFSLDSKAALNRVLWIRFRLVTEAGKAFSPEQDEGSPYPGAKLHFHIAGDQLEDRDWVCQFVRLTTDALPAPKPKKPNN